jgi:hypothetical protein
MTTPTIALERYNRLFDNHLYSAIVDRLAADLRADRDALRLSDAMNLITNAALELVSHPHYTDTWLALAVFCGQNGVSIATIDAIHEYLLIFRQPDDIGAEDFELTAKALLKAYEALDALRGGVSCANGVHGWQGRMAYDLLAAADYLAQAAVQLLMHGNLFYIREKLQAGLNRISGALHEGTRHSERPDLFDFAPDHSRR